MNMTTLLQWQYLIYLLPLGVSAVLLLLSSLHFGHRSAIGHGHGHMAAHSIGHGHGGLHAHAVGAHAGHTHAPLHTHGTPDTSHAAVASSAAHGAHPASHSIKVGNATVQAHVGRVEVARHGPNRENVTLSTNFVLQITGADRAPLAMILEIFALIWGVCGFWANQVTLHSTQPTLHEMLPSLGIALGVGIIGARIGAEFIARIMPQDESLDVSHDGLFGLTGKIAFPATSTAGRIQIYDEHGTLHDEMCRTAPGHATIARGRTALVIDMDNKGNLLVEEVPESVR